MSLPQEFGNIKIDLNRISFFVVPEKWVEKRIEGLKAEIDAILSIEKIKTGKIPKVKSRRYLSLLKQFEEEKRLMLNDWLVAYGHLVQNLSS